MISTSLQSVDIINPEGQRHPGLVPVHSNEAHTLAIDEHVVIDEVQDFHSLDYVFFRRFSDGRSSQVAAYIVDNTDEQHSEQELADLHRQVWLQGKAPLLYITWPGRVDILSCARGEDFWDKQNDQCHYNPAQKLPFDTINVAGNIAQAFSLHQLADGTFWEEASHQALVDHHKMAHNMLIQAVVETDKGFQMRSARCYAACCCSWC